MYYQHIRHILPYSFNSMGKNWGGTWWHTTGGTSTPWRNLERRVSGLRSGFPSGSLAMVQPGQPGSHLKPNLSVKRKLRWHLELIGGLEHVYFSDILGMSSSQLTFTPWFFRGGELWRSFWFLNPNGRSTLLTSRPRAKAPPPEPTPEVDALLPPPAPPPPPEPPDPPAEAEAQAASGWCHPMVIRC